MANLSTYEDVMNMVKDLFDDTGPETNTTIRLVLPQVEFDILTERKWPFLLKEPASPITTVDGTEVYDLASDYDAGGLLRVVDETNNSVLYPISPRYKDQWYPDSSSTGTPLSYYLFGRDSGGVHQIGFNPIPAGAYTINYRYFPMPDPVDLSTDASHDADTPSVPGPYRMLLVYGTLEHLFSKDESGQANLYATKKLNLLRKMHVAYNDTPDQEHVFQSTDEMKPGGPIPPKYPPSYPQA